jgi:hypothetical protein
MTTSSAHLANLRPYFSLNDDCGALKHFSVSFPETRQRITHAHDKNCVRIALISVDMLWAEGLTGSHLQVLFGHFVFKVVFLGL